ncbi:MAG: 16S rRNA (guanine(966)-N(2))-methyltransferase RsmD [Clostridia bacterium]|nr:16S rRNA (guanine(966)-N(2))-methyltransferase RsmD [Clostridia bacterium]
MRIISGSARGKKLLTVEGLDIRPTLDRVKESIFNMIMFDLADSSVLDLFCGSGALGIEALSRGAKNAVFVDNNKMSLDVTQKNLISSMLYEKAKLILSDSLAFLKSTNDKFDIIFIDPPYESELYENALSLIYEKKLLKPEGKIIVELDKVKTPEFNTGGFKVLKDKSYGRVKILIMKE